MKKKLISVTWGKSCNYLPASVEPICWDGTLRVENAAVIYADLLHCRYVAWCQAEEQPARIYTAETDGKTDAVPWKSAVEVGGPLTLEGLRFEVEADKDAVITLDFGHTVARFSLCELEEKEYLRFHAGSKYGGMPIDVFLGPDARPRLSQKQYGEILAQRNDAGCLLIPDDFTENKRGYFYSMYGVCMEAGETAAARFDITDREKAAEELCLIKLQVIGMIGYELEKQLSVEPIRLKLKLADEEFVIDHHVANRCTMPEMVDIYVEVPWTLLKERGNTLSLTYLEGKHPILLHRVSVGDRKPSHAAALPNLPPLPKEKLLHIGVENNMQIAPNGEVDALLDQMYEEELGDYITFRGRNAKVPEADWRRWIDKVKAYGFLAATSDSKPENRALIEEILGERYCGDQAHEISNLAYGWGDPDPIEERITRDLPGCKAAYLKRMGPHRMVGQAMPMQYLDYEAGVQDIMTEVPGSHATLGLHAARGAAAVYGRQMWGVHAANHVTRAPLDQDHVRRLFILVNQCWLHGAKVIQDEEVALCYDHDTTYAFSDPLPTAYRNIYQGLYHYGNNIDLGTPVVKTGFLQGNYDFLVGGAQAAPWVERTKFWGMFGPETEAWTFNTSESGWKLIDHYMPGTWLYPVLQDRTGIRLYFGGSPNGQVDLLPATAPAEKLSAYETLILPGWNTMTEEVYGALCEYVRRGGHLVLCAAQCTEHTTREFLLEKKDFNFYHGGDLSELAGVCVKMSEASIDALCFEDEKVDVGPGIVRLETELCGGKALATDSFGAPVLVENTLGEGRVWLLCVGEYWGADALEHVREAVCRRAAAETPQDVWLTGDKTEVDYYEFRQGDVTRVVLLNTDWTRAGNTKQVTVCTKDLSLPVSVQEGVTKHILICGDAAVMFDVPGAIVSDFTVCGGRLCFTLQGCGEVTVTVCMGRAVRTLCENMGDRWTSKKIEL